MARITVEEVEKVAALARLRLTDSEKESFRSQLDQMVSYVERLNDLDTTEIEPTFSVQDAGATLRGDEIRPSLPQETALMNAPSHSHGYFRVPKMMEKTDPA
ncbi:MAG TPA: Asp-tRNA(Asn)/Glu-tRNA(Gln) amidotransferase subunit GatC [bacterium]|nr:Asp-tRNA(Asn)/Glu-tRNA(Gln) amidotransferase subunit GatC [bacterium]